MAKKTDTAQQQAEQTALAHASHGALAEMLGDMDFDVDGLEGVGASEIKITSLLFNLKGKDEATGKLRQLHEFFNTTTETSEAKVRVAFVAFAKQNVWKRYDDAQNKNEVVCASDNFTGPEASVRGTLRRKHPNLDLSAGVERSCEKCIDAQWHKNDKGKNTRDCSTSYNVFGALLDEKDEPVDVFTIRFYRTSSPTWRNHLNKHHIGKHPTRRGQNVPLFMYACDMSLEVDDSGNFAVPVIKQAATLRRDVVEYLAAQAKRWTELRQDLLDAADKNETRFGGDAIDTEGTSSAATTADDFADR